MQCKQCSKKIISKSAKKFCGSSCAAKYNNSRRSPRTDKSKQRTSSTMVKFYSENLHHSKGILKTKRCNKTCPNCNKDFTIRETIKQTYCSKSCELEYKEKHRDEYIQYVNECKFNFSISDFPDEFNTTLIEKYGWYSAANRGNNLLGVSRDHMYSVKRGFENSVDPKYISHPANCELMRHDYNNKKNYNCSITVNELMDRVRKWDLKYKCVGDRIG